MLKDFRDFISQGSVINLAIGVILGAAFTAIVNSLVEDMFMPLIGALLGVLILRAWFSRWGKHQLITVCSFRR